MRNYADREINDLSRNIQSAQMRMNDIFITIGRTYYNENSNAPQGAYVQMFADLKAAEEQIEQMNTRIKFLKGVVVCTNCKSDNSVNSAFCSVCGTRLPHTFTSDGANRCKNCGNVINPGQLFCGSCGTKVDSEAAKPQQPSRSEQGFSTLAQPEAAPQEPIAQPEAASQEPIAQPAAASQEPIAQPEAASQEPIAQPEAASQEPIAQPETAASQEPIVQPEAAVPEAIPQPEPVVQQRVCPNCGSPVRASDALFCAECGTRL